MENAVDALKMAAAVLVFIIALASSFSLFGTAKETADSVITMRDKQAYLEAAELDGGILYTSSSAIEGETEGLTQEEIDEQRRNKYGVTKSGDRVVTKADVISTIYRYYKEKYGVTILKSDGTVLARFDSSTENYMRLWHTIKDGKNKDDILITAEQQKENFVNDIKDNIKNSYANNIQLNVAKLEELYKVELVGETENREIKCGAPWLVNEDEIPKRIACDLEGIAYQNDDDNQKYTGKGLLNKFESANYIVEVTNEIDKTTYLEDDLDGDGNKDFITNLAQQFEMPTIEIVYIIF